MTSTRPLFLYGTLLDPEQFEIVGGATLRGRPAVLAGFTVYFAKGQPYPVIPRDPNGRAEGLIVDVPEDVRARLDFYEVGFGYYPVPHVVESAEGPFEVDVYMPEEGLDPPGDVWSLTTWQEVHGALARASARDYMRLCGDRSPEAAAWSFPQIKARAASRMRALAEPSPVMPGAVAMPAAEVIETRQPYTQYFGLREDDVRVPTFAGGFGPEVTRASWLGADAVTVLPYDPARDEVLMIRQWRHGPFARGDSNPFCLEPPAGRIDPGETPEDAARREMVEETGVPAGEMHRIAGYYPTPGAFSEHLTSFVAIADLSGRDGTVGGVETEAEDIMSHVVPLDEALALIETGVVNTGPLVLSLYWVAMHRDRLRRTD